jgi:hypothetical protein
VHPAPLFPELTFPCFPPNKMLPRHYWSLIILVGLHPFGARLLAASVSSHCSCRGTVVLVRLKHQPSLVINSVESVETDEHRPTGSEERTKTRSRRSTRGPASSLKFSGPPTREGMAQTVRPVSKPRRTRLQDRTRALLKDGHRQPRSSCRGVSPRAATPPS